MSKSLTFGSFKDICTRETLVREVLFVSSLKQKRNAWHKVSPTPSREQGSQLLEMSVEDIEKILVGAETLPCSPVDEQTQVHKANKRHWIPPEPLPMKAQPKNFRESPTASHQRRSSDSAKNGLFHQKPFRKPRISESPLYNSTQEALPAGINFNVTPQGSPRTATRASAPGRIIGPAAMLCLKESSAEVSDLSVFSCTPENTRSSWCEGVFRPSKCHPRGLTVFAEDEVTNVSNSACQTEMERIRRGSRDIMLEDMYSQAEIPPYNLNDPAKDDSDSKSSGGPHQSDLKTEISDDSCPPLAVESDNLGDLLKRGDCFCQRPMSEKNNAEDEFYLPKVKLSCRCGKVAPILHLARSGDPCDIKNILRPWQVGFLKSQGILTALELLEANEKRGSALIMEMKRWRKQHNLAAFGKKSRGTALHIWARTCKAIVASVQKV